MALPLTHIREQGLLAKLGILSTLNHPPTMCQLIGKCSTVVAYISFRTDYQRARISCLTTVSTPTYSWACDTPVTAVMMFMWCAARHGILFIFDECFPTILDQAKCRIMIPPPGIANRHVNTRQPSLPTRSSLRLPWTLFPIIYVSYLVFQSNVMFY